MNDRYEHGSHSRHPQSRVLSVRAKRAGALTTVVGLLAAAASCGVHGDPTPSTRSTPASAAVATETLPPTTADDLVATSRQQFHLAPASTNAGAPRFLGPKASLATAPARPAAARSTLPDSSAQAFERRGRGFSPVFAPEDLAREPGPVRVEYAATADAPFHLVSEKTGMALDVRMVGATSAKAELGQGYVVYRGGHEAGGHVFHLATPAGTEDFVTLPHSEIHDLSYDVELTAGVAGLRLVSNTLEFVDAKGAPRLRVDPPFAVDSAGVESEATISLTGCAYDTNPAAPWGRPVTAPAATHCTVSVALDPAVSFAYPVLLDPAWTATTNMPTGAGNVGRMAHIAEKIGNSQILVAGGTRNGTTLTNTALILDFSTAPPSWAATGSMITARYAAQSAKTGNTVVVASGSIDINTLQTTATADVYVIAGAGAGTWALSAGSNMNTSRTGAVSAVFADGKVVFAGGANVDNMGSQTILKSTEVYDPADQSFSTNGAWDMSSFRFGHAMSLISDRVVLVTGGTTDPSAVQSLSTTETFDEIGLTWTSRTAMSEGHVYHAQRTLLNGRVLVAGGRKVLSGSLVSSSTTQLYDPTNGTNGTWATQGALATARDGLLGSLLADGKVVVMGGASNNAPLNTSEVFDPGTTLWTSGGTLSVARLSGFTLSPALISGVVLAIGGDNGTFTPQPNVDVFSDLQANGTSCSVNSQCTSGVCVDGVCCNNVCGGGVATDCQACNNAGSIGTCSNVAGGANVVCNASGDLCQADAVCPGGTPVCPARLPRANGTTCRAVAGDCDVAETCNGVATSCPADTFLSNVTLCRAASGFCDLAENCTGTTATCPTDLFKASNVECRASGGACDQAENCTGTSGACPADSLSPGGTVCRPSAGDCDPAEVCTGSAITCPANVVSSGNVCRPAAGGCDIAEICDGVGVSCPADMVVLGGAICHMASDVACDTTTRCNGVTNGCPSGAQPDGTMCPGGMCGGGMCVPTGTDAGGAGDAGGGSSDAGVDAGGGTVDAGTGVDAGSGTPDAGRVVDAGSAVDAGVVVDAGAVRDAGSAVDAGAVVDAGTLHDAGSAIDAGMVIDAGSTVDAGSVIDAGSAIDSGNDASAGTDAGKVADAGGVFDAGSSPANDAGATNDSGARADAGGNPSDAGNEDGADDGGAIATDTNAGCSCRSAGSAPTRSEVPFFSIGLGALVVTRLRRRPRSKQS